LITTANAQNLLVAVDELIRRDTKPVVVAVDTAIFGVDDNSEEIVDSLIKRGIPLKLVKVETNLRECLETTLR